MHEWSEEVRAGLRRIEAYAAESASQVRSVLKSISAEVTDCPRLFTLVKKKRRIPEWVDLEEQYQLTLWCEHPGHEHAWPEATYDIKGAREWLTRVVPYAVLVSKVLRVFVPIAGAAAGVMLSEKQIESAQDEIELTKAVVGALPTVVEQEVSIDGGPGLTISEGAGLRALRAILLEKDRSRAFGGLRRVRTTSGDFLWICSTHYPEYDPGLPRLMR
jgi:internalin A